MVPVAEGRKRRSSGDLRTGGDAAVGTCAQHGGGDLCFCFNGGGCFCSAFLLSVSALCLPCFCFHGGLCFCFHGGGWGEFAGGRKLVAAGEVIVWRRRSRDGKEGEREARDLNFDLHNMFASNEMGSSLIWLICLEKYTSTRPRVKILNLKGSNEEEHLELFDGVRHEFVKRVDQYMQHYEKMISLRVDFLLGSKHSNHIDRWIDYAIVKLFSEGPYGPTLVSEFKGHLRLQNCHLLPRDGFSGFEELKTLLPLNSENL